MSGIEWTDTTWNPTTGCDKVSPDMAAWPPDLRVREWPAGAMA